MSNIINSSKDWIKSVSNIHIQGKQKNIFLFATPRGGSTWLMEIIASQPGMKHYDEPFSIRRDNVKKVGLFKQWEDLMPDAKYDEKIINYIDDLTMNRVGVMNPPPFRKHHRFFTNRIVFKIHELEHIINAVKDRCDGKVLYLLRHPIPTSLSRNVFSRLELFIQSKFYRDKYINNEQRKEALRIIDNGTHLQKGVLTWCLENLIPLKFMDTADWTFVTYEEILLNPRKSCDMLAEKLMLTNVDSMLKAVDLPSTNISMSGNDTHEILEDENSTRRRLKLVTKWKQKVTELDEKNCFDIFNLFEIDAYSINSFISHERYLHHSDTSELVSV